MTELQKYIQTYFGLNNDDLSKVSLFFKRVKLRKGEYFLKAGTYSDRLGFVQTGIVREFVLLDDHEVTKWISTKGYFVVDLSSFVFRQTARWNIQALTDCELYVIDNKDYQKIGQVISRWAELEKLFIAKCFIVLEDRVLQHLSMTAEERYNQLFKFNKDLFNQVPLQYLASMLGMTPETLSRLRKKAAGPTSWGAKIHSTLHTVEPFKNFGWTGKTFGMFAIHNWTLIETNGQTKVSVDESVEGFFAKLLKNSFNKSLEKGMQNWLELLKKECER